MKKCLSYLILLIAIIPFLVNAEEIDMNKKGSLTLIEKFGDTIIANNKINLYKVATSNATGQFTYLDDYDLEDSLEIASASKWNDLAIKIAKYVKDKKIQSIKECTTDTNGTCKLEDLDVGLYLLTSDNTTIGDYSYATSPSLIAIPNYNQVESNYIYDVNALMKIEAKQVIFHNDKNEENEKKTTVPKTLDSVNTYVAIFLISIIALGCLVIYIINLKKKEKKNEKNN